MSENSEKLGIGCMLLCNRPPSMKNRVELYVESYFCGWWSVCLEVSLKMYIFAYIKIQKGNVYCLTLST